MERMKFSSLWKRNGHDVITLSDNSQQKEDNSHPFPLKVNNVNLTLAVALPAMNCWVSNACVKMPIASGDTGTLIWDSVSVHCCSIDSKILLV